MDDYLDRDDADDYDWGDCREYFSFSSQVMQPNLFKYISPASSYV